MPFCEKCQTPYDDWQHFCLQCGQYLKVKPPPTPLLCPNCVTIVSLEQKSCPNCGMPLKNEASRQSRLISRWKWLTRGLIATILIYGMIYASYLFTRPRMVPAPAAESPSLPPIVAENRSVSGDGKANEKSAAVDSLQAEVAEVFNRIKEANLKKNILMYMKTLAVVYPQADQKRQEVLKTWEKFEFREMAFTVNKLQEVDSNNAIAVVKWSTKSQNLATNYLVADDFHYRVWFVKEQGHWKIKKIEEIQP